MPDPHDRKTAWALALVPLAAGLPALILFGILLSRPWETDRVEGLLDAAARGGYSLDRIYPRIEDAWPYPHPYTPLHLQLTGALSRVTGIDALSTGRGVSLFGGLLAAVGVFLYARTLGASSASALAGASLLLSMNPQATFIGCNRSDGLAMGMALLGGALLQGRSASRGVERLRLPAACALLAGSVFAHQRALVVAVALLISYGLRPLAEGERRGSRFMPVLLCSLFALAGGVVLHGATEGRCWFYILKLQGSVELSFPFSMRVFLEAGVLWGAVGLAASLVLATSPSLRWLAPAGVVPLVANLYLCTNIYASRNYFLPIVAVACAFLAAGLSRIDLPRWVRQACWIAFVASSVGHGAWTLIHQIPSRLELLSRGRSSEALVAGLQGPIFSNSYLVALNRNRPDADQTHHTLWLTQRCLPGVWKLHVDRLQRDLESGRYEWVFLPTVTDFPLPDTVLEHHYTRLPEEHPLSRAYHRVYRKVR